MTLHNNNYRVHGVLQRVGVCVILASSVFLCGLILLSCAKKGKITSRIDSRVDSLMSLMTLEEKIGQLNLLTSDWDVTGPTMRANYKADIKAGRVGAIFNAFTAKYTRQLQEIAVKETRLHIPLFFGYDVIHGHRTIFPIPLGLSSSWDLKLIEQSARIAATEASAEGLHWAFGPMVDITRDPRWGRVAEGAGEDTYLGSEISKAMVKGFQGEHIGDLNSVMACVKHFAAYGAAQAGRDYNTVDMSERTLRETYLPAYKAAVEEGVASVMTSFNEVSGVPATANKFLLTDVLRKEWGFNGFIVSDYTAVMELIPHGLAKDTADATALTMNAGLDMDMQSGFYIDKLLKSVKNKTVSEETINASVRRILKVKFELGLFDDPYRYCNETREKETVMKKEFLDFARDAARKSIVLLKNKDKLLPLSKSLKDIAVIGPLADAKHEMIGSWSAAGDWAKSITLLDGIKSKITQAKIHYAKGCNIDDNDTSHFDEAVRAAAQSDVVILAVGEAALMSGEAASRSSLNLPGVQEQLVEAIHKTGKPIVVVLMSGRPLTINWIDNNVSAVLETWFAGTQGGNAIADVLFGDYNPSGKLTITFPKTVGQIPIFYNMKNTGRPRDPKNKYTSKYLDIDNEPLYPFGYGLSYTQFEYGDLLLNKNVLTENETINVSCKITNVGKMDGEEIVQLYLHDVSGSVTRPVKELKRFKKIVLKAGESAIVSFTINANDLSFYRLDMTWGVEPGKFEVFIGPNSRDIKKADFELK